ncbi:hypothetical protein AB0J80_18780 [Actinoplanes sp. NPDC049548]|uniref:hypothetical protein n=1 Tax=Actinoplanes sp. NPDC049548 TaxID=3155152 RepID=UPI00341D2377
MLLDPARIKDAEDAPLAYDGDTDAGAVGAVFAAIVDVQRTGTGTYAGTADLTRQGDAEIVDEPTLKTLGERAKTVPFTATVDGQGRLTSAVVKIPAAEYVVTHDRYGATESLSEPAPDEQQKATEDVYEMLNA